MTKHVHGYPAIIQQFCMDNRSNIAATPPPPATHTKKEKKKLLCTTLKEILMVPLCDGKKPTWN